jgi:hypothetical protein
MDMAHGYLGDGYGTHGEVDPDRDSDRDRHWRERGERDWRGGDWRDREHDRGRMFGEWDRDRSDDDRWSDRSRDENMASGAIPKGAANSARTPTTITAAGGIATWASSTATMPIIAANARNSSIAISTAGVVSATETRNR